MRLLSPPTSPSAALLSLRVGVGVTFLVHGLDVCGRVSPNAGALAGQRMRLVAGMNHMHLIDEDNGKVL